jgi:hypothetical protein
VVVGRKERQRMWGCWGVGNLDSNGLALRYHSTLLSNFAQPHRNYPHAYPNENKDQ